MLTRQIETQSSRVRVRPALKEHAGEDSCDDQAKENEEEQGEHGWQSKCAVPRIGDSLAPIHNAWINRFIIDGAHLHECF